LQYRGNSQHDAQEFLLWLLDRVHEDLNHAVKQSGQPPLKVSACSPWLSQGVGGRVKGEGSLLTNIPWASCIN
jgi:hypothetical protein